jgi:ABC-2 type transport system ATP-binding protein
LVSTHYMDEAERCNRLAYIVQGHLMAEGTIPEIINTVGLITYAATGKNLSDLAHELRQVKGIDQVVIWGNELRITGTDPHLLQEVVTHHKTVSWQQVTTSLESVFIHLVAEGNMDRASAS